MLDQTGVNMKGQEGAAIPPAPSLPTTEPARSDALPSVPVLTPVPASTQSTPAALPAQHEAGDRHPLPRGERVYVSTCLTCHATGVVGAPKLGDRAAWQGRIAQGMDILVRRALEGFRGQAGVMPPKGGYRDLSEAEVADAVAYMVQRSK
jgi:cytochrome c5